MAAIALYNVVGFVVYVYYNSEGRVGGDDNNVVDPNFNIQNFDDEQIEDAVNSILITEVPQFEGYKYPANKSIHGDTNLPPYYALIFIMKI